MAACARRRTMACGSLGRGTISGLKLPALPTDWEEQAVASGVLVVVIALLVLMQGGFFPLAGCALGAIACVAALIAWWRLPQRLAGFPIVPLLFLGMALSYAASALVNGASLTTLSETGVWAACAGAAFLACAQDAGKRTFWMKVLSWFGVATAVGGVLACAGLLSLVDGMLGERLQFTFQYSNAAAAWYGTCALLCLLAPDERLRAFAALPAGALLLTESGGGLVVFAVVAVVVGVLWGRAAQWSRLLDALVQGVLAAVLFAGVRLTMSPASLIALAVVAAACWWLLKGRPGLKLHVDARIGSLALAAVLVLGAIAAIVLLPERVGDALASFGERRFQVVDGLFMWSTKPLLGVGPDNWQYLYPYIQTAPYFVSVVHCSYVQILLDAGIPGLGLFAAACVLGLRAHVRALKDSAAGCRDGLGSQAQPSSAGGAGKAKAASSAGSGRVQVGSAGLGGWALAELVALAFLLAHAALDFDLQFASLAFLLAALLATPDGPAIGAGKAEAATGAKGASIAEAAAGAKAGKGNRHAKAAKAVNGSGKAKADCSPNDPQDASGAGSAKAGMGLVAGLACLVVCLPLCAVGLMCAATTTTLNLARASGDYAAYERLFEASPLAQADVSAQSGYLACFYSEGRYDVVTDLYGRLMAPTDSDALFAALACYAQGDKAQATSVLASHLLERPYDEEFLDSALLLADSYGIDPSESAHFNAAVNQSLDALGR